MMTHYKKTFIFTLILCLVTILSVSFVQIKAQETISSNSSYFDPITIDILAFILSFFLIIEGVYRIIEHRDVLFSKQVTRSIRIAFGCGILTTHILQATFKLYN